MATVSLDLREWAKRLEELDFEKAAKRGFISGAGRSLVILHRATDMAKPASLNGSRGAVNTGHFRRSWKTTVTSTNAVRIFNAASYAETVEGGRRPNSRMPPPDAIRGWAKRRVGLSSKDAKQAAWGMARAIAKRGLKPRNILSGSIKQITDVVIQEVRFELDKELKLK